MAGAVASSGRVIDAGAVRSAFVRREAPGRHLGSQAAAIVAAAEAVAERLGGGAKLLAFGNGGPSTDAQHVAVEFLHPVIVGKRALPALSLVSDAASVTAIAHHHGLDAVFATQLDALGDPDDVAIGISADGNCRNVLQALEQARDRGLLTIALTGGDGGAVAAGGAVDHVLLAEAADPHVIKELHVTTYHLLWELTHAFLDDRSGRTGTAEADVGAGLGALYPFLHDPGGDEGADGSLAADLQASTRTKIDEVVELRRQVAVAAADELAATASALATVFRNGGRLLVFGNGGSSSDAQEVAQSFLAPHQGRPLPALCLTNDVAVLTALSNDVDFAVVFARQVRALGRKGDAVLGLSTSGNSPNVIDAFAQAKAVGMLTIGLAGADGGAMGRAEALDHLVVVPSSSVHRIQEVQTTLYHVLEELTRSALD